MPVTITDAHVRATIEDLIAEAELVTAAVESSRNADKELLALDRAITNTVGALNTQRAKLVGKDVDTASTALARIMGDIAKKTQATAPSFEHGDELNRLCDLYASLAELGRLGDDWKADDFAAAREAWAAVPRKVHRVGGAEVPSLPFAVVIERGGVVVDQAGQQANRVYMSNLKGKIERAATMKLTRDNPQWKALRDQLTSTGVAQVGSVTVRRVGTETAAA